ncbi:putative F-box protein [Panicum miliaceum]|uniref:F-box protein n=1 Tax=Panicum miliaceum TaxID=4540 RepID=A0A3L6T9D4_PANMI|nr:putative F-box protein [Panicum miliaceum]
MPSFPVSGSGSCTPTTKTEQPSTPASDSNLGQDLIENPRRPTYLELRRAEADFRDDKARIHVVDLSGNVVKVIPNPDGHQLLTTRLDLTCAATVSNSCRVLYPATGSIHILPESPASVHLNEENLREPYTHFAFGRIATTGEYKVLRIFDRPSHHLANNEHQLFEVLTINGSGAVHARWRARRSHDDYVEGSSAIVVGEVVYFKLDSIYQTLIEAGVNPGINPDCIISFDLESEEWRDVLRGPIGDIFFTDEYDDHLEDYRPLWSEITIADLRGSLALAHYHNCHHVMDLWLLKDFDNGIWLKECRIQIEPIFPTIEWCVKALFMLDDGRIVIHFPETGLLFLHDPRTNTSARVEMRRLDALAMYTRNLLSLQVGDMV